MKLVRGIAYFLASSAGLLGCSSLPSSPSLPGEIEISATAAGQPCASLPDTVSIALVIANQGPGTFRTYVDTLPGPPYKLSWLSYSVLKESQSGSKVEWGHGAGDHGPLPQNTLAIGPNESTRAFAKIYSATEIDKSATYRIQIEAHDGQVHLSNVFTICQSSNDWSPV